MKTASPSMAACAVVILSCLAWIGGISMVIVHFLQLSEMTGWIIAGSLGFSAVAAATAILFEMRHAVDLENDMGAADFEDFTLPPGWKKPRKSRVIQPRIGTLHMPH